MIRRPQFLRKFSKERSPEERQKLAKEIRAKRAEQRAARLEQEKNDAELQPKHAELKQEMSEREKYMQELLERLGQLNEQLEDMDDGMVEEISNCLEYRSLEADFKLGEKEWMQLQEIQKSDSVKAAAIAEEISANLPRHFRDEQVLLDNFYKEEAEKWANSPFTQEDIVTNFSEEHLASLSVDEYALLLKRFPGEMVTHVTRQGIRDHSSLAFHTKGVGEFHDGFKNILDDGRLRPPLGVHLVEKQKSAAIANFLKLPYLSRTQALEILRDMNDDAIQAHPLMPGHYSDSMAVHFATEAVSDDYYGAETKNEIFIAYPSAFIASQYYFNGQLTEATIPKRNDQWVWANEQEGLDLNAALVFIPEDARVDPRNGSQYELDEKRRPRVQIDNIKAIDSFLQSDSLHSFIEQFDADERLYEKSGSVEHNEFLDEFRNKIIEMFGIQDPRIQDILLNNNYLSGLKAVRHNIDTGMVTEPEPYRAFEIQKILSYEDMYYVRAEDTIFSKEYWEEYFSQHPEQRSSKIIYYTGGDPSRALMNWRESNEISKRSGEKDIGFPERSIHRGAPQAMAGIERFTSIALEVIDNFYHCPSCGRDLETRKNFCSQCGAKFEK
ncbi:MAG: hypothetical protein ABIG66_01795 [Candidatus Kerfeldbacteria bacterium]